MSLPCFPDLTTPSPWAQWQRLAPRLAPTAPLTPLTSGDTSTLRLPGPEAQRGPEAGQLSIILPNRLQDWAGHWQWELKRSQGTEAFSDAPAGETNK